MDSPASNTVCHNTNNGQKPWARWRIEDLGALPIRYSEGLSETGVNQCKAQYRKFHDLARVTQINSFLYVIYAFGNLGSEPWKVKVSQDQDWL